MRESHTREPLVTKRPTIRDVAAKAGVSVATVSRALNRPNDVNAETRRRVLAVVEESSYVPLMAARDLSTQKSPDLTIITPDVSEFGYTEEILGASRVCDDYGVGLAVRYLTKELLSGKNIRGLRDALLAVGRGPIVIVDFLPRANTALMELVEHVDFVPVVRSTDHAQELADVGAGLTPVWINEREVMRVGTQHLIDLGHRHIGHIATPKWRAGERNYGWSDAMTANGLIAPEVEAPNWSASAGYEAAQALLGTNITAIICGSDGLALGALKCLRDRGIRVPEDISVMGFDNRPDSEFYTPALSTVSADFRGLGRASARLAFDRTLDPETVCAEEVAPPTIIDRESAISIAG